MTNKYSIQILCKDNPSLMQRLILIFNRRLVCIKEMKATAIEDKKLFSYNLVIETNPVWAERVVKQIAKQIDVYTVNYFVHMPIQFQNFKQSEFSLSA